MTERLAHRLARAVAELVEAIEDDPDLRRARQVRERPEHHPREELEPLALRERDAPLELRDGVGEPRDGTPELPLQVVGDAALVGRQVEDRDGVREIVRDSAAGDLGPDQRRRQARLARASRVHQHDHRVRPAGLDQLDELGRGLEIPRVLQDLIASRLVLPVPEDIAGVACNVPRQEEAGVFRVIGDVLRRAMPLLPGAGGRPGRGAVPRPRGPPAPTAR